MVELIKQAVAPPLYPPCILPVSRLHLACISPSYLSCRPPASRVYLKQAVARGERVLATAASNTAVDNMAERLLVGRGALRQVVRVP